MGSDKDLLIGVVGACGSGKSTLIEGLATHGFRARHIAQEHSFTPDMWKRISNPDILIYLAVSYGETLKRKKLNWKDREYEEELRRLKHAYKNADLRVDTDSYAPGEILDLVLNFLEGLTTG